jgi:hypothetical protein
LLSGRLSPDPLGLRNARSDPMISPTTLSSLPSSPLQPCVSPLPTCQATKDLKGLSSRVTTSSCTAPSSSSRTRLSVRGRSSTDGGARSCSRCIVDGLQCDRFELHDGQGARVRLILPSPSETTRESSWLMTYPFLLLCRRWVCCLYVLSLVPSFVLDDPLCRAGAYGCVISAKHIGTGEMYVGASRFALVSHRSPHRSQLTVSSNVGRIVGVQSKRSVLLLWSAPTKRTELTASLLLLLVSLLPPRQITNIFSKKILSKRCLREIKLLHHFRGHKNVRSFSRLFPLSFGSIYAGRLALSIEQCYRPGGDVSYN